MVKWERKTLGAIGEFSKGCGIRKNEAGSGKIPCVRYGEIYTQHSDYVKVFYSYISEDVAATSRRLKTGDLLFSGSGETKEEIGKCVAFINEFEAYAGGDIIILRPKIEVDSLFMGYYLNTKSVAEQKASRGQGDAIVHISAASLAEIEIQLPPLPEQRRIAEALSDMDALLAALEKLIAKKRAIKQGTMQELLTGKRRVPGFKGAWVERSIDYFGVFTSGNGFPLVYQGEKAGRYPFYKVSDFSNVGNERIMLRANNYISTSVVASLNCKIIPASSIIFAKIGAAIFLERKRQNKVDCCIDNNMMAFSANSIGDSTYLMYLFQTIKFGDFVTSTALPSLSSKHVGAINKLFPPTKSEQTAIAEILSEMDAEIDALTAKLNKLRNIKQGMMSELLTGRIRLPEQEAENVSAAGAVPNTVELPKSKPEPAAAPVNGHNQHFDDAVMIAGIVDALYSDKFLLGRKKVQKCLYLLRRHQDESTAAFKKKAAGPYADVVRYKGGEPIACSANYVTTTTNDKGTTFARGSDIDEALAYIQSWGKQGDIAWVADKLKYKKGDELELLATVDMAICDLTDAGIPVSVDSIKHLIATNKEWKAKLKKQTFSDENIAYAIRELQTLL